MIDTWQKAVKNDEKGAKNGKKAAKNDEKSARNDGKTAKNDGKTAKMARIAVKTAWFLTFGCCRRGQWVLPKKPLGAAEETNGCRGRNRWFPPRKPQETKVANKRTIAKRRLNHLAIVLLGYPDSNQERQDQNLQCYHYTIPQTCGAFSRMRVQRYCFFWNLQKKRRIFYKKAQKKPFLHRFIKNKVYLCTSKQIRDKR